MNYSSSRIEFIVDTKPISHLNIGSMDISNDNTDEQSLIDDPLLPSLNETDSNSHLIDYQGENIHQQIDQFNLPR